MSLVKHPRQLLVIIAEASLENLLVLDVKRIGAHGYTIYDVRGSGASGNREGAWEADRTIRMEVICDTATADEIASYVMATYSQNYGLTLFFADVKVLRPKKY
jgi:nitrogen regulatory protein P-II 2